MNNNNNSIATIELNTVESGDQETYLWVPEISDNVAPGLDSILTYLEHKYATITELQNTNEQTITYIDDNFLNDDKIAPYI